MFDLVVLSELEVRERLGDGGGSGVLELQAAFQRWGEHVVGANPTRLVYIPSGDGSLRQKYN